MTRRRGILATMWNPRTAKTDCVATGARGTSLATRPTSLTTPIHQAPCQTRS